MLSRWSPISRYFCCAILLVSCGTPPPAFEQLGLDEAQTLVQSERWLNVLDVQGDDLRRAPLSRSSVSWTLRRDEPPTLPALTDAPVLVVASGPGLGYRAAGLIASERNREVYLVIIETLGDRARLFARDPGDSAEKETNRGRDS